MIIKLKYFVKIFANFKINLKYFKAPELNNLIKAI